MRKADVRGALNMYFCLLVSERFVINVGDVDASKQRLCPRPQQSLVLLRHLDLFLPPPPPLVWLRRCKSAASTPSASLDAEHQDVATAATMFLLSDKLEGDALVTWRALSQKAPAASKERLLKVPQTGFREAGFVRLVERMQVPAAREEPLDPPNARAMLPALAAALEHILLTELCFCVSGHASPDLALYRILHVPTGAAQQRTPSEHPWKGVLKP